MLEPAHVFPAVGPARACWARSFYDRLETLAIAGVVAAGLGFANIWPMLFSITVEESPKRQRTSGP